MTHFLLCFALLLFMISGGIAGGTPPQTKGQKWTTTPVPSTEPPSPSPEQLDDLSLESYSEGPLNAVVTYKCIANCPADPATREADRWVDPNGRWSCPGVVDWQSIVGPGSTVEFRLQSNDGPLSWKFTGDPDYWPSADFIAGSLSDLEGPLSEWSIQVTNQPVPGEHRLCWVSVPATNTTVCIKVPVSCHDGCLCNGSEQFVQGKCQKPVYTLCDDLDVCTFDFCDENHGFCTHEMDYTTYTAEQCPTCRAAKCIPRCPPKAQCGTDGCGGMCGEVCATGSSCVDGTCQVVPELEGTCRKPIDITADAQEIFFNGTIHITGDNRNGLHQITPLCNQASTAKELVYLIINTENRNIGLEVRMMGINGDPNSLDTLLELIEVNPATYADPSDGCVQCGQFPSNVCVPACSDDASPPGAIGSRITWGLRPGYHYYIVADAYSSSQNGEFQLNVTLSSAGCTLQCSGRECGDAKCDGFLCGTCGDGQECNSLGRCVASPCAPDCSRGRQCGDDGCGGSCGTCRAGSLCNRDTGKCRKTEPCDHYVPLCRNGVNGNFGCPAQSFCGSDCQCHKIDEPLMDLLVDPNGVYDPATGTSKLIFTTMLVGDADCALLEGCISETGCRKVIRFSQNVGNQGRADFNPAYPPASHPEIYEWGACHGHWHYTGFAEFALLYPDTKKIAVKGRKQSYCAEDSYQIQVGSNINCEHSYFCDKQGLSRGFVDVYGPDLDCQFLDVTDLAPGRYILRQCTNQLRTYPEETFFNNCVYHEFIYPGIEDNCSGKRHVSSINATIGAHKSVLRPRK